MRERQEIQSNLPAPSHQACPRMGTTPCCLGGLTVAAPDGVLGEYVFAQAGVTVQGGVVICRNGAGVPECWARITSVR